jgi:hypothetical protein
MSAEVGEQLWSIVRFNKTVQRRASECPLGYAQQHRVQPSSILSPRSTGSNAPFTVPQCVPSQLDCRTRHGPGTEGRANSGRYRFRCNSESEPQTREPVSLAEGAKDGRIRRLVRNQRRIVIKVGKSLVNNEPSAAPVEVISQIQKCLPRDKAPIRIVGIHHHEDIASSRVSGRGNFHDLMPSFAPSDCMLRIGWT